ncbi:nucleoside triphosphatase [bacterium]|nr:nucleoside triphosphatase [bacterium]
MENPSNQPPERQEGGSCVVVITESRNSIIEETTDTYLQANALRFQQTPHPAPTRIESELLTAINDNIEIKNAGILSKKRQNTFLTELPSNVIAKILLFLYPIVMLVLEGGGKLLAIYHREGSKKGLYVTDEAPIRQLASQFNPTASESTLDDIIQKLKRDAPQHTLTRERDLIAVNNGVFDYKTKTLLPFSPDMFFTSKSGVDYNPNAANVVIHNPEDNSDWDLETWMASLSDNPEIVNLLWELSGAIIRPNVSWNKSAWLYSPVGNNGKGTLCVLMRNLCGEESCESINVKQFNGDVFLENLMNVSAVIADENEPGTYVDSGVNLKAAITGDKITINRKYKSRLSFKFRGFIVQCLNELPKVKDRTSSFQRRLLIIPMTKCFTGCERKYIKDDYLYRKEVLEYALYRVLNMDYYNLSEPQACRDMLAEYQEYNNPLVEYWKEFRGQFAWDLLPNQFLYDLYKEWLKKNCPSGKLLSRNSFCRDIRNVVAGDSDWEVLESPRDPGNKMDKPEYLSLQYGLGDWQNKYYYGIDETRKCTPSNLKSSYRGLIRRAPLTSGGCEEDGAKND